ncbi:MAG: hypothetical protein ABWY71_01245 [Candidatus Saccharimonadales bacterium]
MEPTDPQQPSYGTPIPPPPGSVQPGVNPLAPPPKKDRSKLMLIVLCSTVGVLVLLVLGALLWPHKTKAPATQKPKAAPVGEYYHIDTVKSSGHTKGSYDYTVNLTNPATNVTQKRDLTTEWPIVNRAMRPMQFSADDGTYLFGIADASDASYAAVPNSFELVVGRWPQSHEKVIIKDVDFNDGIDWLLTADGKEVVYVDTVLNDQKVVLTQTLYSYNISNGKSTKIGDVSRPMDRNNTGLFEVIKDKTVSFYTAQDDGIYQTKYDRNKHTVTNTKVVIKSYDTGSLGQPSPDGTKLIYFGNNAAANATTYLFDLKDGGVTPLVKTPAKYGGYSGGYWSPDSKLIVVTSSLKDVDGAHYKNQVTTIDTVVKSTKTEVIAENTALAAENPKNFYSVTSWSADGRYITYVQNNQLHYYDLDQKKLLPDVVAPDSGIANVNGWITKL